MFPNSFLFFNFFFLNTESLLEDWNKSYKPKLARINIHPEVKPDMINILPEVKPASSKYEHPEDKKSKQGRHKQNDLTKEKTTNKGSKAL